MRSADMGQEGGPSQTCMKTQPQSIAAAPLRTDHDSHRAPRPHLDHGAGLMTVRRVGVDAFPFSCNLLY